MAIRSPFCIIISFMKAWSTVVLSSTIADFRCRSRCNRFAEGLVTAHSMLALFECPRSVFLSRPHGAFPSYQTSPQTHSAFSSFFTKNPECSCFHAIVMDDTVVDVSRAEANEDDWHSVKDAKKRKQIQDRLAQRARSRSSFRFHRSSGGYLKVYFDLCYHEGQSQAFT
jgi:hypothetical protein